MGQLLWLKLSAHVHHAKLCTAGRTCMKTRKLHVVFTNVSRHARLIVVVNMLSVLAPVLL
jgi:hypothetical protein